MNVSIVFLIKKKILRACLVSFLLEEGQAEASESLRQRDRKSFATRCENTAGWRRLANTGSHRRSCAQKDQVSPERPQGNKPLPQRHCLHKVCVEVQDRQTNRSEKEALEKVIKIEGKALPPLQFRLNHRQDIHENPLGAEGQGDLECEFSA